MLRERRLREEGEGPTGGPDRSAKAGGSGERGRALCGREAPGCLTGGALAGAVRRGPVCWARTEGWAGRVGKERGRAGLDRVLSERAVCVAGPGELRETGRGELACGPDVAEGERREALRGLL